MAANSEAIIVFLLPYSNYETWPHLHSQLCHCESKQVLDSSGRGDSTHPSRLTKMATSWHLLCISHYTQSSRVKQGRKGGGSRKRGVRFSYPIPLWLDLTGRRRLFNLLPFQAWFELADLAHKKGSGPWRRAEGWLLLWQATCFFPQHNLSQVFYQNLLSASHLTWPFWSHPHW